MTAKLKVEFTKAQIAKAKRMVLAGTSWQAIGRALNCNPDTIRRRLDPKWKEYRAAMIRSVKHADGYVNMNRIPEVRKCKREEAERRMAEIPADTRSLSQRIMGDPLPGRSALDKRHAG